MGVATSVCNFVCVCVSTVLCPDCKLKESQWSEVRIPCLIMLAKWWCFLESNANAFIQNFLGGIFLLDFLAT